MRHSNDIFEAWFFLILLLAVYAALAVVTLKMILK